MSADHGRATDSLSIGVLAGLGEHARASTLFRVEKWDGDQIGWARRRLDLDRPPGWEPSARHFAAAGVAPFEVYEKPDANLILNAGWALLMNGAGGPAVTKYTTSAGRIGGGISSAATAATQTDLQAATGAANRQWEILSSNPVVGATGAAGIAFAATFPTTDGNFAWAEFGVDQGTSAGTGGECGDDAEPWPGVAGHQDRLDDVDRHRDGDVGVKAARVKTATLT